ncbi:hypothetical protein SLA2020_508430 [Shorea laevis]
MEYQNYLRKVGREGFQIIDAYSRQVQPKVATRKAPVPPSKDVAVSGNGWQNADQVPQTAKPKEPVTLYICKVPQVPTGNWGILTSDQAAKTYGGFVRKEYYY